MLVNLTKEEMKTIIFYLIGDTNKQAVSVVDKLQPILEACECQQQKQNSPTNNMIHIITLITIVAIASALIILYVYNPHN